MWLCVQCVIYKSDCTVLYCCVGKVLCMHIFNKAFRVLKKKKKAHGSLMGQKTVKAPRTKFQIPRKVTF